MAEETNTPAAENDVVAESAPADAPAADASAGEGVGAAAPAPAYTPGAPSAPGSYAPRRFSPGGPGGKRFPRRKVCVFCVDKVDYVDYKDMKRIRKFVTERGKILPRRISGNCASHQRMLTGAIKRARVIALLPFKGE